MKFPNIFKEVRNELTKTVATPTNLIKSTPRPDATVKLQANSGDEYNPIPAGVTTPTEKADKSIKDAFKRKRHAERLWLASNEYHSSESYDNYESF